MRIALISYEYAGSAKGGGIGTYVRNAARMLATRGHEVEVFTGSVPADPVSLPGLQIHGVPGPRDGFANQVVPVFAARHGVAPFDVVEGPDYEAEARGIATQFPDIPYVVKLHMVGALAHTLYGQEVSVLRKARYILGTLRRLTWPKPYWRYDRQTDPDYKNSLAADVITSPSQAVATATTKIWPDMPAPRLLPNVFQAAPILLEAAPDRQGTTVLYLGRLEHRKGVLDLARAVPLVRRHHPEVQFRFIGQVLPHPITRRSMKDEMLACLGAEASAVSFVDSLPWDQAMAEIAAAPIAVFPSLWENFPNVCLEAMAAACGVIGSSAGGMAEIITPGQTGLLVPPRAPAKIAEAIIQMIEAPAQRIEMGRAARAHVTTAYGPDAIGPLQEAAYQAAIDVAWGGHDG